MGVSAAAAATARSLNIKTANCLKGPNLFLHYEAPSIKILMSSIFCQMTKLIWNDVRTTGLACAVRK